MKLQFREARIHFLGVGDSLLGWHYLRAQHATIIPHQEKWSDGTSSRTMEQEISPVCRKTNDFRSSCMRMYRLFTFRILITHGEANPGGFYGDLGKTKKNNQGTAFRHGVLLLSACNPLNPNFSTSGSPVSIACLWYMLLEQEYVFYWLWE